MGGQRFLAVHPLSIKSLHTARRASTLYPHGGDTTRVGLRFIELSPPLFVSGELFEHVLFGELQLLGRFVIRQGLRKFP